MLKIAQGHSMQSFIWNKWKFVQMNSQVWYLTASSVLQYFFLCPVSIQIERQNYFSCRIHLCLALCIRQLGFFKLSLNL